MVQMFRLMHSMIIALTVAVVISGCMGKREPKPVGASHLPSLLAKLDGEYVLQGQTKIFQHTNKIKMDAIISAEDRQQVLPVLVDCMEDITPTETLLERRPVMLGILCFQALTQIIYYESTDSHGDITSHWPGHISPVATIGELQNAKKSWLQVLKNKAYVFR